MNGPLIVPEVSFAAGLLTTVLLLVFVIYTGRAARRRAHLVFVALAVSSLLVTIYFAEQLGTFYDIESAGIITPIHLFFAKLTTVLYLAPIITGVMTLKRAKRVRFHRVAAYTVMALTVITAGTGLTMILLAQAL